MNSKKIEKQCGADGSTDECGEQPDDEASAIAVEQGPTRLGGAAHPDRDESDRVGHVRRDRGEADREECGIADDGGQTGDVSDQTRAEPGDDE